MQLQRSAFGSRSTRLGLVGPAASRRRVKACVSVPETRTQNFEALSSTEPSEDSLSSMEDVEFVDHVITFSAKPQRRVLAPPNSPPIVILPGFGNCTKDYTEPFGKKEASIASGLEARGFKVYVLPLERKDWARVVWALLKPAFWSGSLTTDPGYTWYLKLVDATVKLALKETGAQQVDLIGHSAGGWLARAYIGDTGFFPTEGHSSGSVGSEKSSPQGVGTPAQGMSFARLTAALPSLPPMLLTLGGSTTATEVGSGSADGVKPESRPVLKPNPRVRSLVTLGSPQRAVPVEKGTDKTGGALSWVHRTYPGAFFADAGLRYVSVGSRTVRGYREPNEQTKGMRTPPQYAFDSYQEVCGEGQGVEGDAVVPLSCAFLGGAQRQVVLDGVYHSMSRIGTFDEDNGAIWYGSEQVLDSWLWALVDPLDTE